MQAPAPGDGPDPPDGAPSEEDLYDVYLTAAREGRADDPDRFLAPFPDASPEPVGVALPGDHRSVAE